MATRQCEAITKKGRRCQARSERGSNVCGPHKVQGPTFPVETRQASTEELQRGRQQ